MTAETRKGLILLGLVFIGLGVLNNLLFIPRGLFLGLGAVFGIFVAGLIAFTFADILREWFGRGAKDD